MNWKNYSICIISILFITVLPAFAETSQEQVQISLNYPNGDRAELSDAKIIISSDKEKLAEIIGNRDIQFFETTLPHGNHYKVEVFINEIFSGYQIFAVEKSTELHIPIPFSSGVRFSVFYDDGQTPIPNATVVLKTKSGFDVSESQTDLDGKAMRFWIPAVINQDDYYIPEIRLGEKVVFYPDTIRPSSGSSEIKVVTKWPKSIESVPISVYTENSRKLTDSDGVYFVSLFENENKLAESKLDRGETRFSDIKVGEYRVAVSKMIDNNLTEVESRHVILNEKNSQLDMVLNPTHEVLLKQNTPKTESKIIEKFQTGHKWKKQSAQGSQSDDSFHFVSGDQSLSITTDGDGKPVFSRSPRYSSIDMSDKIIFVRLEVDDPTHLRELSFSFTDDDTKSSWYVVKINPADLSGKWQDLKIDLRDAQIIGAPNIKSINKIQVRVTDNNQKATIYLNEISVYQNNYVQTKPKDSCNCVAFRMDDIQDFWLNEVQIKILETFKEHDTPLTIGIIGNSFGEDKRLIDYIKKELGSQANLEVANHGWKHEDFTQFTYDEQLDLLQKTNKKITETLLKKPTVFIPPMNLYNDETVMALSDTGFTHFSSELDKSNPPYQFSTLEIYQFPETAVTGNLNSEGTSFLKIGWRETLSQIEYSKQKYGFAVVTLHPQEFSIIQDGKYTNNLDDSQFSGLESLLQNIKSSGTDVVFISEINQKTNAEIPSWIKNSGVWWHDGKISGKEFVKSIEYLVKQKIISMTKTEKQEGRTTEIPDWIKSSTYWWATGKIPNSEYVSSIQFLIDSGIIEI